MTNTASIVTSSIPRQRTDDPPTARLYVASDGTGIEVVLEGNTDALTAAAGDAPALMQSISLDLITMGGLTGQLDDPFAADAAMSWLAAMKPEGPAEAGLVTQMIAVHRATIYMTRQMATNQRPEDLDRTERSLNRLARTYATQLEALKRYRSKGQQTVRVERVTVEPGGQAIVGNVQSGRGVE